MNKLQKWVALALCVSMMAGIAAFAEGTEPVPTDVPAAPAAAELADDTVVVTVNGEAITWKDVQPYYDSLVESDGAYFDMTDPEMVKMFRSFAMENRITEVLVMQQAKNNGMEPTAEEVEALNAQADAIWNEAIQNYITSYYPDLTAESSEEEKTEANTVATAYFNEMGYSPESLREAYVRNEIFSRVENTITKDVVVTDEDVEADYQAKVAADKELYENDISAYIDYNMYVEQMAPYAAMYGMEAMEKAWYRPGGIRLVKHILLPVDETLLNNYKDLQARLEEQMNVEESGEATAQPDAATAGAAEPEATAEVKAPVTQADMDNAEAEILASLEGKIEEINDKIAQGVDFDELIATYAVKEDGTPTDPGMTTEPTKTTGYEIASGSTNYVAGFVKAAFSIDQVGEASAPHVSPYGVHIVKYVGNLEAGPVPMTAEEREARRTTLLDEKKSEKISATVEEWLKAADLVYSGAIPSLAEIEAAQVAVDGEEEPAADVDVVTVEEGTAPSEEEAVPVETAVPQG